MSTIAKHTPGPWTTEPMEDGCSVAYRINDGAGYEIAVTSGRDNEGEEEANAHLIAAAPEMLEALRPFAALADVRDATDPNMPDDYQVAAYMEGFRGPVVMVTLGDCRAARAVLSKVEGQ